MSVGKKDNAKALLLLRERTVISLSAFVEVVIWRVPSPLRGSNHSFKYRLALVAEETCVLRYDNEAGKGDHKHVNGEEVFFPFSTIEQLVDDFWHDVELWRKQQ